MDDKNEQLKVNKYVKKIEAENISKFFNETTLSLIQNEIKNNYEINKIITQNNPHMSNYTLSNLLVFDYDKEYYLTNMNGAYIEENNLLQENLFYDILEICNNGFGNFDFANEIYNKIIKYHIFLSYFYYNNVLESELISINKLNKFTKNFVKIALKIIEEINSENELREDPNFNII